MVNGHHYRLLYHVIPASKHTSSGREPEGRAAWLAQANDVAGGGSGLHDNL